MSATPLQRAWNLDFTQSRQQNTARFLRLQSLDYGKRGRGNNAWKRLDRLQRAEAPYTVSWPLMT